MYYYSVIFIILKYYTDVEFLRIDFGKFGEFMQLPRLPTATPRPAPFPGMATENVTADSPVSYPCLARTFRRRPPEKGAGP